MNRAEQVAAIKKRLAERAPDAVACCESKEADLVYLHQGAFGLDESELLLLGSFIKYAGECGKSVQVLVKDTP